MARAHLWRSKVGQRLTAAMTPDDFERFDRLVAENGLSEADLADIGRRWRRRRRKGETLVAFLGRTGWSYHADVLLLQGSFRTIDYGYL
jgi:hypothetical protein